MDFSNSANKASLSLAQREQIENICERFEKALRSDTSPLIESFLETAPDELRDAVLRELLLIDREVKESKGEPFDLVEYRRRFAQYSSVIDSFSTTPQSKPATTGELETVARETSFSDLPRSDDSISRTFGTAQPESGCQFGRFELRNLLGQGAFGAVYRAYDPQLDREVAIKIPRSGKLHDDRAAQRFLREARAAAQLRHPNIVPIHDAAQIDGTYYIASGFIQGQTLRSVIKAGPRLAESQDHGSDRRALVFTERDSAVLICKLAAALHYAHTKGIFHRDVKPENIMVDEQGEPHVMDFGLARRSEGEELLTREDAVMGTAAYMSPEQARGESHLADARSDLWSLGVVLYELLTGRRPFPGKNLESLMLEILQRELTPPRKLTSTISKDLDTICQKCLNKAPEHRYQSCQELADELEHYLRGEPISARRISQLERTWRWAKRRPAVALLAVVSLLACVSMAVGGVYYAEAAHQRAQLAEQGLRERKAIDDLRREAQLLLVRGEQSLQVDHLQEARVHVEKSLSLIGDKAEFAREAANANRLNATLKLRLAEAAEKVAAQRVLSDFAVHRDSALFYGSQLFGLDPNKNQGIAEREALSALSLVALDQDKSTRPSMPKYWSDDQRARVHTQCYELLLVLAESLVQTTPGSNPDSERLQRARLTIDRATAMYGRVTEAARLQRREYTAALGDGQPAEPEAASTAVSETAADYFLLGKLQMRTASMSPASLDDARKNFEQALRLEPDHFWAQYCLGMNFLRLGRADMAKVHLTACATRRGDFPWLYVLRGSAQSSLREFDLAEADFRRVLELKPDEEARHVTLVNWGVMQFQRVELAEAERLLLEALELRPQSHQAYLSLAKVYESQQRVPENIAAIDKVIEFAPEAAIGYRERARLRMRQSDFAGAAADLEAASSRPATSPRERADDLTRLGEVRFRQNQPEESLRSFSLAIAADRDFAPAHLWRGAVLVELKQNREALAAFDAYLRKGKPTVELYMTRGMCRASMGNYSGAIDDYSRAIDLKPTAETFAKRGWLYALRGNPLIGLRDFEKALAIEADNVGARCGRAQALARLGQHELAIADAEAAIAKGPNTLENSYIAATVFAVAASRAFRTSPSGPSSEKLQTRYRARAFQLIAEALSRETPQRRETFWREVIEADPQWLLLAQTPEFKKLRSLIVPTTAGAPRGGTDR